MMLSVTGCGQTESNSGLDEPSNNKDETSNSGLDETSNKYETEIFVVKEQIGDEQSSAFKFRKEIDNENEVKAVNDILNTQDWELNTDVEAPPPDYRLNEFVIWVAPDRTSLEIAQQDELKYVRMDEEDAKILYKIMTGDELN
jgi:hypothetical protein